MSIRSTRTMLLAVLVCLQGSVLLPQAVGQMQSAPEEGKRAVVVDDFESDRAGAYPSKWGHFSTKEEVILPLAPFMRERKKGTIEQEGRNKFLRVFTQGEALRITRAAEEMGWTLDRHPRLRWRWRALRLPEGAREDRVNDTGGALYVTFPKRDWLGRPYSIKYTYSSTLPVGTVVSTGPVKVIVVSSGANEIGSWKEVTRDVRADYRRVFGGEPPGDPVSITLWSDSDNTEGTGAVDFDDIMLLPRR